MIFKMGFNVIFHVEIYMILNVWIYMIFDVAVKMLRMSQETRNVRSDNSLTQRTRGPRKPINDQDTTLRRRGMEDISDYILEDGFPGFRVFLPDVGRFQVLWTFRNLRICGKGKKLEVLLQIWASRISGWVKIDLPDLEINILGSEISESPKYPKM